MELRDRDGCVIRTFAVGGVVDCIACVHARLAIVASDGVVKMWDVDSGRELVKLICFKDGQWIAVTSDGYFVSVRLPPS